MPPLPLAAPDVPTEVERRRPGRIKSADAELIPLMRKPNPAQHLLEDVADKWEPREPVLPPRGIALGVVLCVPIWLVIGEIFYQLLK